MKRGAGNVDDEVGVEEGPESVQRADPALADAVGPRYRSPSAVGKPLKVLVNGKQVLHPLLREAEGRIRRS